MFLDLQFSEYIHLKSMVGDHDAVRQILQHTPHKVHSTNGRLTVPPLFHAARYGHLRVCEVLVAHGADVNYQEQGWTCLHEACARDHLDVVAFLLNHRVDPNATMTFSGMTGLMHAVRRHLRDMTALLLRHGADVWQETLQGKTAIDFATDAGCRDLLETTMKRELLWKAWACVNPWILALHVPRHRREDALPSVTVFCPILQHLVEDVPHEIFQECVEYL